MSRKHLLTYVLAVLLSLLAWGGATLVSHGERLATVETQATTLGKWLERVEGKLDRVLATP